MYVYKWEQSSQKYTVGYFAPDGTFKVESRKATAKLARRRVNYLNGGPVPQG